MTLIRRPRPWLVLLYTIGSLWAQAGLWAQGGPPGGSVAEILISAADPAVLFAATNAGVLRSNARGFSWDPARNGLTSFNMSSVVGDGTVLYAATFDSGVFRSRDGGRNWQPVNNGLDPLVIFSLAIDPNDPNTVYAGTNDNGIFKTTNAGDQWTTASTGLSSGNYVQIVVDPSNSQVLYAAHVSLQIPGAGSLAKSTNGGQSWGAAGGPAVLSVALDPSAPSTIYVGTVSGLLKSTDGGANFGPLTASGARIQSIAVDPSDPAVVYAASRQFGIIKSVDGGQSFETSTAGLPRTDLLDVLVDPENPARLYAASDGGGVFVSEDAAATWQPSSNGILAADALAFAIQPQEPAVLLTGISGGGIFRSSNRGATWAESRAGFTSFQARAIAFDPVNPATVYAGSINPFSAEDGSLFRSTDGGALWELRSTGFTVFDLAAHPTDGRTVYVATNTGLFRTTDGGENFDDASGADGEIAFNPNTAVAIDPNNPGTLYAISVNNFVSPNLYQIYKSTNSGESWTGSGDTELQLTSVEVDPNDSSLVLVGSNAGVFRSTDTGGEYNRSNAGLPDDGAVLVNSFAFDRNDNSTIYAGTSSGVFKSADRAQSWTAANTGLEGLFVRSVNVDPQQARTLYAATANGGVFRSIDGGATWQPTGGLTQLTAAGVVNAADFTTGGIAPGEIISIFGQNMGPVQGVITSLDATGKLPTSAAGVTVFVGGQPAPLFFVRQDQINLQVPFEVAGSEQVEVRLEVNGTTGNTVTIPIVSSKPGIFRSILNQNSTVNSANRPAEVRSVIQMFTTGQGLVTPAVETGRPGPGAPPFPEPELPVSVTVGGRAAGVQFRGLAPGFVGLLQINVRLPANLPSGPSEVIVRIGDESTPVAATVHVQ